MSFSDFLKSLFGPKPQGTTTGVSGRAAILPDNNNEPPQICSPKVLLIIYNPTMDTATGKKMVDYMSWGRPDPMVGAFISEVLQASGGLVRYQIAKRIELDEFPVLTDGFSYTPTAYTNVVKHGAPAHSPSGIDYNALLSRFSVLPSIADRTYDEVWIMAFPYAGLYESTMGGAGAFWCNGPAIPNTASCARRFVVMGFSYERQVGEMLHSYNHRAESIMARVFNSQDFLVWAYKRDRSPATITPGQSLNFFQRFILFEQIAPGKSGIGLVHYPPNGARDYDLGNPNLVQSECYDWLGFPNFQGDVRMISCSEWGGGDERLYQRWWLRHLPRVAGRQNGIHNNWWQYVANPDNVMV
jgi:hypothetical protein